MPNVDTAVCPIPTNIKLTKNMHRTILRIWLLASCSIKIFSSHAVEDSSIFSLCILLHYRTYTVYSDGNILKNAEYSETILQKKALFLLTNF